MSGQTIVKKWQSTGLLENFDDSKKIICSNYFETIGAYILSDIKFELSGPIFFSILERILIRTNYRELNPIEIFDKWDDFYNESKSQSFLTDCSANIDWECDLATNFCEKI